MFVPRASSRVCSSAKAVGGQVEKTMTLDPDGRATLKVSHCYLSE